MRVIVIWRDESESGGGVVATLLTIPVGVRQLEPGLPQGGTSVRFFRERREDLHEVVAAGGPCVLPEGIRESSRRGRYTFGYENGGYVQVLGAVGDHQARRLDACRHRG